MRIAVAVGGEGGRGVEGIAVEVRVGMDWRSNSSSGAAHKEVSVEPEKSTV